MKIDKKLNSKKFIPAKFLVLIFFSLRKFLPAKFLSSTYLVLLLGVISCKAHRVTCDSLMYSESVCFENDEALICP